MRRAAAVLFALLATVACGRKELQAPAPQKESSVPVVIISVDTLRSDRLPAYGYGAGSTPAIDALRRDSVLFDTAFSHCPQTLPSHVNLFTGLLPAQSGVRDNIGYVLKPGVRTLASILKENGYGTGAAVSSYVLRKATGIEQGFDFFDDNLDYDSAERATSAERDGTKTESALESWLPASGGGKVFAFLHIYEPHAPYEPPPQFATAANPYDGEVSYSDAIVGRFLDALRTRGLYDDALIVFLSDHGEGLGDHGEDEHGIFLYREAIQVPLLIKLPRGERRGQTSHVVAGITDIMPTILARLSIAPPEGLAGIDLFRADAGAAPREIYSETYFPRFHFGWHELFAMTGDQYHYIDAPKVELYDYRSDPGERSNIAADNRRIVASLRKELEAVPRPFQAPTAVDPEDQRKLAALGYIGSSAATGGDLPDAKDRIASLDAFKRAILLFRRGDDRKTIAVLEEFLATNDSVVDAWGLLSQSYQRIGRRDKAIEALKTAMRRYPGNPHVALALSELLLGMKRYGEARAHAELALKENGVLAHEMLARIALATKDLAEAEKQGTAALQMAPSRTSTLLIMASVRQAQGNQFEELQYIDRARGELADRKLPPMRGLAFRRGELLLRLGRPQEAEAAFREEVRLFPQALEAWGNLAVLLGARGRTAEAHELLREAMAKNPGPEARAMAAEAEGVLAGR